MNLSSKLNKHFVAMGAVAAAFVGVQAANAAIVSSGIVNIPIPANIDGVYLNVVTGATGTSGAGTAGWDVNPYGGTSLQLFSPGSPAASHGYVAGLGASTTAPDNLPGGTLIDGAIGFSGTGVAPAFDTALPVILNSSNNYIGFRFFNEATSTINYGWMRIELGASLADGTRKIVEYAYENTGAGITVVPAPASAALLGLGGLVAARRRRN